MKPQPRHSVPRLLAPLLALALAAPAAGVTRHVSGFFAYPDDGIDDTEFINNAIAAAQPGDVVQFDAGTYDLIAPCDEKRFLRISAKAGITLQGATSGGAPATTLLRHVTDENMASPPRTLYVFNSADITVSGFIVDNTPHLCTTGTVAAIDPDGKYVRVQIPAGLPLVGDRACYAANVWDPATLDLKQVPNLSANSSPGNWTVFDAGNRILQLHREAGLAFLGSLSPGDRMSWHYGWNGLSQIEAAGCTNLALENLLVRNAINMAILIGSTDGVALTDIVMKPAGGQLPVGPRDGIHLSRCTGVVTCDGLEITGVRMDGLVVRTPYAEITSVTNAREFTVETEIGTFGQPIAAGTSLTLFSPTGNRYTRVVDSASYTVAGDYYTITIRTDLPTFATVGTVMKLGGLAPASVDITDSVFENIAGSALILFADNITVDDVTGRNVMYPAIHLGDNTGSGVCGANLVIRNSTFDACGWLPKPESGIGGLITLANVNATYAEPKLHDVTIENNTFRNHLRGVTNPAVNAFDTGGLTLTGNLFENVGQPVLIDAATVTGDVVTASDVVIDNDGNPATYAEVAGAFSTSSLTGYNGSTTRYAGANGVARWSFTAPRSGDYAVYVYKIVHGTSDTHAKLTVENNAADAVTHVDCTAGTTGWHYLGTHAYTGGVSYQVTNARTNGHLRADAVLFQQM